MISVDGLTVEFGDRALFKDISFQINEKDRIALMGKNGAGKSTLLKILAGQRKPSRGNVSAPKDTVIAYLPQHLMTEDGRSVYEEASQAFAPLFAMEKRIDDLNRQLTERTDYDSPEYYKLIEEVSALSEKYYSIDLTHFEADVEKTLLGLGFKREDLQRQTSDFSGGWRMRIELAKMLLKNPDVLLLDEPTNHLDIDSIQWLEEFLISNGKAVVVISHDRTFVDNITTRTIEVTMGRIYDYKVNYSKYLELRKDRRAQQQKAYDEQQKMIAETKDFIERFKGTYSKTLQVQSRVKMLEKLELIEVDEELTVFQTVDDVTPSELKSNTKNLLGAFMFSGDDIDKKVKVLSGGERTRLAMIKLLLQPVNLLILDEPTNHLDLKTKDILKNALIDFDGTLIVVSHDRDFLNGLAQKVYEFGNGKVTEHLEDINGFLRKKKMENLREIESRKS